ncbi:Putative metal-dependent hydrolase YfiT [Stieleria maiorica]|uniref:Metal-dependent hydrolase YfiT n=1 Tax=Stieleria maiorica TaxID=2795974 RepID=A0A5B9ME71_9BACT|nr:DinB family protein [Stieleria maiorica]QEF97795.1 Putative metal-dependent hydrolase YfiT [Stieleria maiorica]
METSTHLVIQYAAGPTLLHDVVAKLSAEQLDAVPIPGKWSTRQVVCHIADFELVYADRMKRVIAEHQPTFFGGDPGVFAAGLAYESRDLREELDVIESVRKQMTRILRLLNKRDFERIGHHSDDGPISLETLLGNVTNHLPHHVAYIEDKLAALDRDG